MRAAWLFILWVLSISGFAQSYLKIELNYEVSQISSRSGSNPYSPSQSLYGCAGYETVLFPWLSISPALAFHQRGHDRDSLTMEKVRISHLSLQLPISIFLFPDEKKVQPFFILGPYLGLKTNARLYNVHFSFSQEPLDFSTAFASRIRPIDYGILLATGVSHRWEKIVISVSAKYHFGLSPIGEVSVPGPSTDFVDFVIRQNGKLRAYGFSIAMAYKI